MDQSPPPPDDRYDDLLIAAQDLISWLIGETARLLALGGGVKILRWTLRHLLTPAEALMRRALRLLADELPAPIPRPQATAKAPPRAGTPPPPAPRRPVFRLNEPLPGARRSWLPVNQRPRFSVAGLAPPRAPADAGALEARLRRRLEALKAALADPVPLARRLLRQRMKSPAPRPALAYDRPPGLKAKPLGADGEAVFRQLNDIARRLEPAATDSS